MKTAEDFKIAAQKKNITFFGIHNCSFCHYACGFIIKQDTVNPVVYYDNGCDCTWNPAKPSSFQEIANHYNMQKNEKYMKEMNEFWGF